MLDSNIVKSAVIAVLIDSWFPYEPKLWVGKKLEGGSYGLFEDTT
jgi:hypothetical protein